MKWLLIPAAMLVVFLAYWIINPVENGSTFRDWIRRFPRS